MTENQAAMAPVAEDGTRARLFATIGRAALVAGALAFIPPAIGLAHVAQARAEQSESAARPASFADLAANVSPAVVIISSSR